MFSTTFKVTADRPRPWGGGGGVTELLAGPARRYRDRRAICGTFPLLHPVPPVKIPDMGATDRRPSETDDEGDFMPVHFSWRLASTAAAAALVAIAAAFAQEPPAATPEAPAAAPPADRRAVRVYLMEGSVVSGVLSVDALTVRTEFGVLEIPVDHVESFTPGLASHPQLQKRIGRLIQQLGSNDATERDQAQRELTDFGPAIRSQIASFREDEDAERKSRIERILEEVDNQDEDEPALAAGRQPSLIAEDTVETDRFTVVGTISPESFAIETPFGPLNVALRDIRYVSRESEGKPERRTKLLVDATSLPQSGLKDTGVRLERGDRLVVASSGQIVMPWGNNIASGPDGAGQNVPFYTANIASGALIGRIGRGEEFLIGSRFDDTVKASGPLFLGVAMNAQFANQGYSFPGNYDIRIRVNPTDK